MKLKRYLAVLLAVATLALMCGSASAGLLDDLGGMVDSMLGSDNEFESEDLKTKLDAVEAFYDEYCTFMKKYAKNPDDAGLLADYATMMSRYAAAEHALASIDEDELSDEDIAYYTKVMARIAQKLAETGLSMG